jgi:hypothetical protein
MHNAGSKTDAGASTIMHNGLASSNITPHRPRAQSRIPKPLTQPAWAGRGTEQKEAHLGGSLVDAVHAGRFRHSSEALMKMSTLICLKHRPRPPTGRRRPDVFGPLRPPTESGGLRCVATGPARALASTNDLHRLHWPLGRHCKPRSVPNARLYDVLTLLLIQRDHGLAYIFYRGT